MINNNENNIDFAQIIEHEAFTSPKIKPSEEKWQEEQNSRKFCGRW